MTNSTKVPGGNTLMDAGKVLEKTGITQDMKVADFGCGGMGYFTLTAAKMVGKNGLVYGVDILKTALQGVQEQARAQGLNNVKTVWSNLEVYKATKIESASLDLGLLINVLFQSSKDLDIIRECARMIKVGGKFLIVDWKRTGAPFGPLVKERVVPEETTKLASQVNLKLEKSFEAGPYHFGMLFVKKG